MRTWILVLLAPIYILLHQKCRFMKYIIVGLSVSLILVWLIYSAALGDLRPWMYDYYDKVCWACTCMVFVSGAIGMAIGYHVYDSKKGRSDLWESNK